MQRLDPIVQLNAIQEIANNSAWGEQGKSLFKRVVPTGIKMIREHKGSLEELIGKISARITKSLDKRSPMTSSFYQMIAERRIVWPDNFNQFCQQYKIPTLDFKSLSSPQRRQ